MSREHNPSSVPQGAQQDGSTRLRWNWVEPSVWTDRMLTALEEGVKGGVWFRLFDKVFAGENLLASYHRMESNKSKAAGVDHVTVEDFGKRLSRNLETLTQSLRDGAYRPQAIRRVFIPKDGSNELRPLGIPTVRDRVVQGAVRHVVEPIFEREFAAQSYGFRPGRGCRDALQRVDELLAEGCTHVVDVDLKSYFDTIPHDRLMQLVRQRVADGRVLGLIESFLKAGIMNGLEEWTPEAGAPQGAVLSPLLSNIYLNPLDHLMAAEGFQMVRYADDFVILCRSSEEAEAARAIVSQWCESAGLTLHPTKTRVLDAEGETFDFLGYTFAKRKTGERTRWPRRKSDRKVKSSIHAKTKRTSGRSMTSVIKDVNKTLMGWFGYFKDSLPSTFESLDGWVRARLRGILRRRLGMRGRASPSDNRRWPNAYFEKLGLFSLKRAHEIRCQSPRG